jgi:hypothetical protein
MTTEFPPFPNGSSFDAKFDGAIADGEASSITLNAARDEKQKEAVIDAGLRSLDHCMMSQHPVTMAKMRRSGLENA